MTQRSFDRALRPMRWGVLFLAACLWVGGLFACGGPSTQNNQNNQNNNQTNTNQNNNQNANNNQNNNNQNNNNQNANTNVNNDNTNNNNDNTNVNNNANQNNNTPPTIPGELKPKSWGSLSLSVRSHELHKELLDDPTLQMVLMGKDLWVGGKQGLFRWVNGQFDKIDGKGVIGLAVWTLEKDQKGLLIARADGIDVWLNQTIAPSSLNNVLQSGDKIRVMVARGAKDLWIGTEKTLWRWQNESTPMQQFKQIKGVQSLLTHHDAKELIVHTADHQIVVLREEQSSWVSRALQGEVKDTTMEAILPWKDGDFWGIAKEKLFLRKRTEQQAAWWPFRLKPDKDKDFEWSVQLMALDPQAGAVWLWGKDGILRVDEDEARTLSWKQAPDKVVLFRVALDEALWLSDGKVLWRVGQEGPVTTYEKNIKPFVEQSCLKCHKQGGSAEFKPFVTYDDVRKSVNDMIRRIEDKTSPMPPPPNQLVGGDAETLRRWIQGGYHR